MRRRRGRFVVPAALAYGVLAASRGAFAANGTPFDPHSANDLTLAVHGDAPYGTSPTDTTEFEATSGPAGRSITSAWRP